MNTWQVDFEGEYHEYDSEDGALYSKEEWESDNPGKTAVLIASPVSAEKALGDVQEMLESLRAGMDLTPETNVWDAGYCAALALTIGYVKAMKETL